MNISFLDKPNVVGTALGYKIKNGMYTCEKCIKTFASKKIPENKIPPQYLVPAEYNRVKTDVIESGTFKFLH